MTNDADIRPRKRPKSKNGEKAIARETAKAMGHTRFMWRCHRGHGWALFGTAGDGQCILCKKEHTAAAMARKKAA